jgi:hypothetical protein
MLPSWCSQTITVIRPGTKTSRGSAIPDWENPIKQTDVGGCSVQPAATSLNEDGRVLGITDGLTVYVPPGTDILAGDHIVFEGETYEINGEPRAWTSPTGRTTHIMLNATRYSG